jgi:hypothetical protein
MTNIDLEELATVVGGAGDYMDPIRDRNGNIVGGPGAYNKYTEESRKSPAEKFNEHMDKVNQSWKLLNTLGRGTRGRGPRPTPPYRPRID